MKEQINMAKAKKASTLQKISKDKGLSSITFVDNHPQTFQKSQLIKSIINSEILVSQRKVLQLNGVKGLSGKAKKKFVRDLATEFGILEKTVNTYIDSDDFNNKEHFKEWIRYYKSYITKLQDAQLTKEELYFTKEGWKRRKSGENADADPTASQQVKIYRTMPLSKWNALRDGSTTDISGHLGDYAEALSYLVGEQGSGKEVNVLVELPLIIGQENALFSPTNLVFPKVKKGKATSTDPDDLPANLKEIFDARKREEGDSYTLNASPSEGIPDDSDDKLGIKSEERGMAGFSIAIGNSPTRSTKLMSMIDRPNMGVLGYKEPLEKFQMLNQKKTDFDYANEEHKRAIRVIL